VGEAAARIAIGVARGARRFRITAVRTLDSTPRRACEVPWHRRRSRRAPAGDTRRTSRWTARAGPPRTTDQDAHQIFRSRDAGTLHAAVRWHKKEDPP
jgi:hypothetical protein